MAGLIAAAMSDRGNRPDGTKKGSGWLGVLPISYPGGKTGEATEYSVGVNIGGKEVLIPSLVPTLTDEEKKLMLGKIIPEGQQVPADIMQKAVQFAVERIKQGLSPFKEEE